MFRRKSRREITCQLAGTKTAKMMRDFEAVLEAVAAKYPGAHREGSAGGWSWTRDGVVVAASCFIAARPAGRHWLAIRPN